MICQIIFILVKNSLVGRIFFYGICYNTYCCCKKKVNDIINRNKKDLYLGAIAPDAAKKIIGIDRNITHFIKEDNVDTPNIAYFKQLYFDKIKSDYDLGYYIHLLTDELWFSEFLPNFVLDDETIIDPSGEKVSLVGITIGDIIYNDYTNLNAKIIDYYNLDLKLFMKNLNILVQL